MLHSNHCVHVLLNILTGVLVNVIESPLYVNNVNFTVGLSPDGLRSPFLLSNASSPNLDNSPEGGRTYLRGRKMIEHNSPTAEENITAALEEKKASNYVRKAARSLEYLVGSLANLPHYISHGGIQKFSTGKKKTLRKQWQMIQNFKHVFECYCCYNDTKWRISTIIFSRLPKRLHCVHD